ncbi:MAG: hypothetical protein ABIJ34_09430, partial [archaeon]
MENKAIDSYTISCDNIPLQIHIYSQRGAPVPIYHLSLLNITDETRRIIERIREDIITSLSFNITESKGKDRELEIKVQFRQKLKEIIRTQFSDVDEFTTDVITNYIIVTSLGLAEIEFLLRDP